MFQYAALKGMARFHGYDFAIPPREHFGKHSIYEKTRESCLYNIFNLEERNTLLFTQYPNSQERVHNFDDEFFHQCPDNNAGSAEADLCLMRLCTYHIIANSSFSWWGPG